MSCMIIVVAICVVVVIVRCVMQRVLILVTIIRGVCIHLRMIGIRGGLVVIVIGVAIGVGWCIVIAL